MANEIKVRGDKEDDGVFMFGGETFGFLVGDGEGFGFAVISSSDRFTIIIVKFDTIKISVALNDVFVGGAETFAASKDINSF